MKANGKNLRMYIYKLQYYMDLKHEVGFGTAKSYEEMQESLDQMNANWSSGVFFDIQGVTPEEFCAARQSNYWKGYEAQLDNLALDCTQEWLDKYCSLLNN